MAKVRVKPLKVDPQTERNNNLLERIMVERVDPFYMQKKQSRQRKYVYMRSIVCAILRYQGARIVEIAHLLGKAEHSAAIHMASVHVQNMSGNDAISKAYRDLYWLVERTFALEKNKEINLELLDYMPPAWVYAGLTTQLLSLRHRGKKRSR